MATKNTTAKTTPTNAKAPTKYGHANIGNQHSRKHAVQPVAAPPAPGTTIATLAMAEAPLPNFRTGSARQLRTAHMQTLCAQYGGAVPTAEVLALWANPETAPHLTKKGTVEPAAGWVTWLVNNGVLVRGTQKVKV